MDVPSRLAPKDWYTNALSESTLANNGGDCMTLGCVHSGHADGEENGRADLWYFVSLLYSL